MKTQCSQKWVKNKQTKKRVCACDRGSGEPVYPIPSSGLREADLEPVSHTSTLLGCFGITQWVHPLEVPILLFLGKTLSRELACRLCYILQCPQVPMNSHWKCHLLREKIIAPSFPFQIPLILLSFLKNKFIYLFIHSFIFGCVGSLLLCAGFL